jgi:hypothetical protein
MAGHASGGEGHQDDVGRDPCPDDQRHGSEHDVPKREPLRSIHGLLHSTGLADKGIAREAGRSGKTIRAWLREIVSHGGPTG